MAKPNLYKINTKISRAWWCAPLAPATQEDERWKDHLNWGSMIMPLHSNLGENETLSPHKKKNKQKQTNKKREFKFEESRTNISSSYLTVTLSWDPWGPRSCPGPGLGALSLFRPRPWEAHPVLDGFNVTSMPTPNYYLHPTSPPSYVGVYLHA